MKTAITNMAKGLLVVPALALALSFAAVPAAETTSAFDQGITDGANSAQGTDQQSDLFGTTGIFRTITNVLLFLIGAVSVIMLIIGGIRYTVSGGDSTAVTGAKNTILYAIVGIVVALLAFAVVNFVLGSFSTDN
ncbi:MAG: pilin [Patescibacteria group bacterium]